MSSNYALRGAPAVTLTDTEQRAVLRATGESSRTYRDHVLVSVALGTGARIHELAALKVADVLHQGQVRRRVALRVYKGHRRARRRRGARPVQWLILPDECRRKLAIYVRGRSPSSPLFSSRQGGPLSTRQMRELWRLWQVRAGLERHHTFHRLRATFLTNVYEATRDPVLTQRTARHARLETTLGYVGVSDERTERAVRSIRC
jgi:integrase